MILNHDYKHLSFDVYLQTSPNHARITKKMGLKETFAE
jgi:hypothetical protein